MSLLSVPVGLSIVLSLICAVAIVASPRVFRRRSRRLIAALGFIVYFIVQLLEAPRAAGWSADLASVSFWRWMLQLWPSIMALWLMRKIDSERDHLPDKSALWENGAS